MANGRWSVRSPEAAEATWQSHAGWRRIIVLSGYVLLLAGVACLWADAGPLELEQSGLQARAAALWSGEVRMGGAAKGTRAAVSRLQSKLHELRATQLEERAGRRGGRGGRGRGRGVASSEPLSGEGADAAPGEGRGRGRGRRGGRKAAESEIEPQVEADPEVEAAPEVVSRLGCIPAALQKP